MASGLNSLNDFLITDRTGLLAPDLDKLRALPAEDFRTGYIGDMDRYISNYSRLSGDGKYISCDKCSNPINKGSDLIRYYGNNFHHHCFVPEFKEDKESRRLSSERDSEYFEMILERVVFPLDAIV